MSDAYSSLCIVINVSAHQLQQHMIEMIQLPYQ